MSVDYMLLGELSGERPIGRVDEVLRRARAIGVDLTRDRVTVEGVRLELTLDVQGGDVACVHVTPRGTGDAAAAMRRLAGAIGAVVFDAQTGRGLGAPEPTLPDATSDYELHLVSIDLTVLGDETDLGHRLRRSLGPSFEGDGWRLLPRIVAKKGIAQYVVLRASWSSAAARDELFERLVEAAKENGWVPFDAVRNDTIGG
jgi:hypothetical protein